MFKLLAVLALVSASAAHRFKGAEYKQTKMVDNYEYKRINWDEAHEYEECEEFDDRYEELMEGVGKDGEEALNGMDHFMSRHIPKPIEDICDFTVGTCPNFSRKDSGKCGFETVVIPAGHWMVADIDKSYEKFLVRSAYKEKLFYGYRSPNKMRFVTPVILKWHLDADGNRERGEIAMYIPEEHQSNPPLSKSDKVRVEEWKETTVFVRPYGGYRDDDAFGKQFEFLRKAVSKAELSYDKNIEMEAGYTYLRYGRQRIEAMLVEDSSRI
ncbi:hypothetical protein ACHWQZ_G008140 [Mnemiopsis leidyi]